MCLLIILHVELIVFRLRFNCKNTKVEKKHSTTTIPIMIREVELFNIIGLPRTIPIYTIMWYVIWVLSNFCHPFTNYLRIYSAMRVRINVVLVTSRSARLKTTYWVGALTWLYKGHKQHRQSSKKQVHLFLYKANMLFNI